MRLIDADYVLDHLKPYEPSDEEWSVTGGTALRLIHKAVDTAPTVDAVPVVHGRWEMRPTGIATDTGPEYKAYCTVCNEPNKQYQPPFCPHCGAKMDGKNG